MDNYQLQQLMQQAQIKPGLLGEIGQGQAPAAQNLISRGQQAAGQMAQQGQIANQAAAQAANNIQAQLAAGEQANAQALANRQAGQNQALGLMLNLLPMGKWLGIGGK